DVFAGLVGEDEDAAVAAFRDLPVQPEVEIPVPGPGQDVAATRTGELDGAILDDPSVAQPVALEIAPLRQVLAIEQQLPTVLLFLPGQLVVAGEGAEAGDRQQQGIQPMSRVQGRSPPVPIPG